MKSKVERLSQERLKELFRYDKETGIFTWRIARGGKAQAGMIAGSRKATGYVHIKIDGNLYQAHRLAYLYVYGYMPENTVDHKNRTPWHNWIENLREASKSCNVRNSGNRRDNKSGIKGVTWHSAIGKWYACIMAKGSQKSLGVYTDFDDAVCARLAAEQCLNWSGCDSSSSAYKHVKAMTGV